MGTILLWGLAVIFVGWAIRATVKRLTTAEIGSEVRELCGIIRSLKR